jgi:hypothetical protein
MHRPQNGGGRKNHVIPSFSVMGKAPMHVPRGKLSGKGEDGGACMAFHQDLVHIGALHSLTGLIVVGILS